LVEVISIPFLVCSCQHSANNPFYTVPIHASYLCLETYSVGAGIDEGEHSYCSFSSGAIFDFPFTLCYASVSTRRPRLFPIQITLHIKARRGRAEQQNNSHSLFPQCSAFVKKSYNTSSMWLLGPLYIGLAKLKSA